jgi:crotonobetainyl-CoA:carnitine CoA-transferase CaiB-like acyl-CoA transferase
VTGYRIEIAGTAPPYAMLLSDMGADVVRIDRAEVPGRRTAAPYYDVMGRAGARWRST